MALWRPRGSSRCARNLEKSYIERAVFVVPLRAVHLSAGAFFAEATIGMEADERLQVGVFGPEFVAD